MILKITRKEIIDTLKKVYNIKDIKFMRHVDYEGECEVFDMFEYVEGELK